MFGSRKNKKVPMGCVRSRSFIFYTITTYILLNYLYRLIDDDLLICLFVLTGRGDHQIITSVRLQVSMIVVILR